MRDLYATTMQLVHVGGGTAFDVACERAMKWAWRVGGEAPDLSQEPSGRVTSGDEGDETAVIWTSIGSIAPRALEIQLRHPDNTDPTVRWHGVIAISEVQNLTRATLRLGLDATVHSLRPLRLSLRAPSLVPRLMQAPLRAYSGTMELEPGVRVVSADQARSLVQDELAAEGRALPILVCSRQVNHRSAGEMARGLAGLAQVVRPRDGDAEEALRSALAGSGFTIPKGGLRLFWPGFGGDDGVRRQPYWTAAQLRSRRPGGSALDQLVRLIAPISAARVPPDPGILAARQESLRERRAQQRAREEALRERARRQRENSKRALREAKQAASDDEAQHLKGRLAEIEALLDLAETERDEADKRSKGSEETELAALGEAEAYSQKVESLKAENAALRQNLEVMRRYKDLGEEADPAEDAIPDHVDSWREIAENVEDLEGPGFYFSDRARECASEKNRYPNPGVVWEALRDLERTGRAYNEMGAELGMRFEQFASEQAGLAVALQDGTYEDHWFEFEGGWYSRLPHVKIDDAKAPNEVGRIYFAIDGEGKRLIVDWFGTKPDRPNTKRTPQTAA